MKLAGTFEIHNQIYWEGFLLMKICNIYVGWDSLL